MGVHTNVGLWLRIGVVAFAYLFAFPYFPRLNNPNENVRFYMTAAIAEYGTYEISAIRARWGWTNDQAKVDGRFFSVKAPGTSLAGVPAYWVYRTVAAARNKPFSKPMAMWLCRLSASTFPALVFLWFFLRWLRNEFDDPVVIDAAFFSLALGSLFYAYGVLFVSHSLSAICAFAAFWRIRSTQDHTVGGAFWTGLFAAGVTFFEYPGLPASVILTAYFLSRALPSPTRRWSRIAAFVAGGLLPTLAVMHFQWHAFGSPLLPGHLFVETDAFRAAHEEGFFGATHLHGRALVALLFDLTVGLIPGTPLAALAVWGAIVNLRDDVQRHATVVALSLFATTFVAITFMNNWRGGWSLGPRYLALAVPFVLWLAARGASELRASAPATGAVLLTAMTLVATLGTGMLSIYFPHIPPQVEIPSRDLMATFLAHDYAPLNLLNRFGVWGTLSMLPIIAVLALVPLTLMRNGKWYLLPIPIALCAAFFVAQWLWPLTPSSIRGTVFEVWHPNGYDAVSLTRQRLLKARTLKDEQAIEANSEKLIALYKSESRFRRAARLRREMERIRRAEGQNAQASPGMPPAIGDISAKKSDASVDDRDASVEGQLPKTIQRSLIGRPAQKSK